MTEYKNKTRSPTQLTHKHIYRIPRKEKQIIQRWFKINTLKQSKIRLPSSKHRHNIPLEQEVQSTPLQQQRPFQLHPPRPSHLKEFILPLHPSVTISFKLVRNQQTSSVHAVTTEFAQTLNRVLEHMLGTPRDLYFCEFVSNMCRVSAAICCLTCGVVAAILPLVIPSCQDVEHTCPNCTASSHVNDLIIGGFLMARYRRGVNNAKVFPVEQGGYMAVSQSETVPAQQFSQQSGLAEPAKK